MQAQHLSPACVRPWRKARISASWAGVRRFESRRRFLLTERLQFEWDEAKAHHFARHGVKPEEAAQVIADDPLDFSAIGYSVNT